MLSRAPIVIFRWFLLLSKPRPVQLRGTHGLGVDQLPVGAHRAGAVVHRGRAAHGAPLLEQEAVHGVDPQVFQKLRGRQRSAVIGILNVLN